MVGSYNARSWQTCLFSFLLALSITSLMATAQEAPAVDWKATISRLLRKALLRTVDDKTFAFEEAPFAVTLKAIEPDKNIDVTITKLAWEAKKLNLGVSVVGRFQVNSITKIGAADEPSSVEMQVKMSLVANAEIALALRDPFLILTPHVLDIKPDIEIEKLTPDPSPIFKETLSQAIKKVAESRKDALLESFFAELKEIRFDYTEAIKHSIREHALAHSTEDTAWKTEEKLEFSETKSWLWLDDPDSLKITVVKFSLEDDALDFSIAVSTRFKGRVWGRIRRVVKADTKMKGNLSLRIEGRLNLGFDKPMAISISNIEAAVTELRFNNDLFDALRNPIQDGLNQYFQETKDTWRQKIEQKIAEQIANESK